MVDLFGHLQPDQDRVAATAASGRGDILPVRFEPEQNVGNQAEDPYHNLRRRQVITNPVSNSPAGRTTRKPRPMMPTPIINRRSQRLTFIPG